MKKIVIDENHANQRIDKYLKKLLCQAPSQLIYKMLRKKDVKVNGVKAVSYTHLYFDDYIISWFNSKSIFWE